jgi:hypothetical protein
VGLLQRFFQDKWLEIAIVAICFQLLTSGVALYLGDRPATLIVTAIVVLLLVGVGTVAAEQWRARKRLTGGEFQWGSELKEGVIFTLGLRSHEDSGTVMKMIRTIKPKYVGFLATQGTAKANITASIVDQAGLSDDHWREKIVDPTNVSEVRDDTKHLIDWMQTCGLATSEILVDITGGTAVVSVGAFMAADDARVDTVYVYSDFKDNKPIEGSQRPLRIASYKTP